MLTPASYIRAGVTPLYCSGSLPRRVVAAPETELVFNLDHSFPVYVKCVFRKFLDIRKN